VDVKSALTELESAKGHAKPPADEHVFLALDKNVAGFPWESIPILRGRGVSRVPSLPIMLDQVQLLRALSPPAPGAQSKAAFDGRFKIDSRKVFYILNSSGDLARTQTYFEPWLTTMAAKGWKGIVGRSPTELEMVDALTRYDLVL
jgi:separase